METTIESLQYPIGRFVLPQEVSSAEIKEAIRQISLLPSQMAEAVHGLNDEHLDTPYRPGGWTVRQVIHHVPDSHMNAYMRYKLALTEDSPVIKPYEEAAWANLIDSTMAPDISLQLLKILHLKWAAVMEDMSEAEWSRDFIHPEYNRHQTLAQTVMLYAWHGSHHLAHIVKLKERMNW